MTDANQQIDRGPLFGMITDDAIPSAIATGIAHQRAGRLPDAIACYQHLLLSRPEHPRLLALLGEARLAAGETNLGLSHLAHAARLLPDDDQICFAYANACIKAEDHDQAIELYRLLLARAPDHLGCALNLIALLRYRNDYGAAAAVVTVALSHHPAQPPLLLARAACALAQQEPLSALALLDLLLSQQPDLAEAHFLRGTSLNMLGRAAEAIDAQYCAIALDPRHAAAHLNLGNALADLDCAAAAAAYCARALEIDPALVEAYVSLGYIFTLLCRLDDAMLACRKALTLSPRHVQAHWNLGIAALLAGDWALGWRQYEWRKRPELYAAHFRIPSGEEWRGGELAGRTLTVCAEQGLGDAIHLARYLPLLATRGAKLILSCAAPLIPLFADLPFIDAVRDRADPLPPADLWVDQMTLPGLFGTTPSNIPAAEGYLAADPARLRRWKAILPGGPKVGLAWGGNPDHSNDRRRSIPAEMIESLLAIPGISFISLQVGRSMPQRWAPLVFDAGVRFNDFAETAACIAALDLVITIDTSIAHLAGAMGCAAWVMLPFAPDWRWLLGRTETPWYDSVQLFRQRAAGDWANVIDRVGTALRGFAGSL